MMMMVVVDLMVELLIEVVANGDEFLGDETFLLFLSFLGENFKTSFFSSFAIIFSFDFSTIVPTVGAKSFWAKLTKLTGGADDDKKDGLFVNDRLRSFFFETFSFSFSFGFLIARPVNKGGSTWGDGGNSILGGSHEGILGLC